MHSVVPLVNKVLIQAGLLGANVRIEDPQNPMATTEVRVEDGTGG